jgi:tripartite ATP-independent transporter DctM subunit
MEKGGYTRRFAAAVTAASSVIGPIIPPSIIMVLYALVMNVSVAGLFAAGFVPGLIMGLGLMVATGILARRRAFPRRESRASPGEMWSAFRGAFFPLLTPLIILGGILSGVFTPTEAAGAAAAYALLISIVVTRTLRVGDLRGVLLRTGVASATVLLIVGTATLFAGAVTLSGFPNKLAQLMFGITDNPYHILLLVNVLLLIVGMFLDAGPAILVLGPILAPAMAQIGVHPLHFAIIMCVNLTVGLATPPMGLVLFVASTLTRLQVLDIAREMIPFLGVHLVVILLITYFPALSMTLPRLLGYY